MRLRLLWLCLTTAVVSCSQPEQVKVEHGSTAKTHGEHALTVVVGPTSIPRGDAQGAKDITVRNEFFALAFAAETASPWGVAKGGILDIAIMDDGKPGVDFVSLVDFMPNHWSAWPTSYQKIELEKNTAEQVIVRAQRDWGEVELDTRFEIRAGSKLVRLHTRMLNPTTHPIQDITTGYIAWPKGGQLFGMPGLFNEYSIPVSETKALANWSASYDERWALGLHAPYAQLMSYQGRDRYLKHNLQAGQAREFEAWLQIEDSADLSQMVQTEISFSDIKSGNVYGWITDTRGMPVDSSAVVVESQNRLHSWTLVSDGRFDMSLPAGDYEVYAAAAGYAPGSRHKVSVLEGEAVELALSDLQAPAKVTFSVVDRELKSPLNAVIGITQGTKPVIKYFGRSRFFTSLDKPGYVELSIPPGDYAFDISAAGGFTSNVLPMSATIDPGERVDLKVEIDVLARPASQHWYAADLHHHSDVLDGFTEPEFVLRAQLAAGVDIAFLSDHDSIVNNAEMTRLTNLRDMSFIGGTELSASWAHFNAYPIDSEKIVNPEVGLLSVQGIYKEARRLGAEVIHVNHPYGNYGYFDSLLQEADTGAAPGSVVPGGYDPGFDLIEITVEHVPQTLKRVWQLWNEGKPAYFAAGSDVHDVWNVDPQYASGAARSYVYVPGELTVDNFVAALKAGHAYASQGPLIYPENIFGSELSHTAGEPLELNFNVQSVAGLVSVQLIEQGVEKQTLRYDGEVNSMTESQFIVRPSADTWYSLVVEDVAGNYAYSNPWWIKMK